MTMGLPVTELKDLTTQDDAPAVYNWSVEEYINLVENTQNPTLKKFELVELDYLLNKISSPQTKTFIDVGAGYGRVLPYIAPPPELEISLLLK